MLQEEDEILGKSDATEFDAIISNDFESNNLKNVFDDVANKLESENAKSKMEMIETQKLHSDLLLKISKLFQDVKAMKEALAEETAKLDKDIEALKEESDRQVRYMISMKKKQDNEMKVTMKDIRNMNLRLDRIEAKLNNNSSEKLLKPSHD